MSFRNLVALFFLIFATSCATNEERIQKNLSKIWGVYFSKNFDQTKSVDVFVVTNRKSKGGSFGCDDNQFGVVGDSKLQFGVCSVNVPRNHIVGEIQVAKDSRQSAHDYFKILEAKSLAQSDLILSLKNTKRTPLIFVHGFNVRYQEAVLRAAQIAYDLKYQGPVVLFTWPSGASDGFFEDKMLNRTYENNLFNAKSSIGLFKSFLSELQKNDIKVNLVVHSMGHQVVLPALRQLGFQDSSNYINQLILNAPDFDVNEFKNASAEIKRTAAHITLYCSYNDKAMVASKVFNKGERLGACAALDGFDTINVGLIDDSALGLGHGYYSSRAILSDLFQTLIGIDADKRLFIIKSEPNGSEKYLLRQ